MRITIFGAGAVGGVLAATLLRSGLNPTLIARGAHLQALQNNGLTFKTRETTEHWPVTTLPDTSTLPPQDIVFITLKSYSIPEIACKISPLMHDDTIIIPLINGIPWWFTETLPNKTLRPIQCLDSQGEIKKHIPTASLLGGVSYMAATVQQPGIVVNLERPGITVGEPDHSQTDRLETVGNILQSAESPRTTTTDIHRVIWTKLCWNVAFNPLSVITGLTSGPLATTAETKNHAIRLMEEMAQIAAALNIDLRLDIGKHIQIAEHAGTHKPSMLQDYEAGKPLEIDAILGSVLELAEQTATQTPNIKDIYLKLKSIIEQ